LQEEYDIEVDWRGFELHPETPEGGLPITALYPGERLAMAREYLKRFAEGFGIADMAEHDTIPNTRRALAAAEYAREKGKLDEFRIHAMELYWRSGLNIEDDESLRAVAEQVGLDPEATVNAADDPEYLGRVDAMGLEARRMGITGIPTFLIGENRVVGCQPYEMLSEVAQQAGAKTRNSD
jgi:predicted DsbA family dithiol-disulfide isomerase